ncbi:MAG: response regulator [Candidatus Cloacimonetes bacterium]|nr:response regulator [Candidatus Cloacimonadota bacterium]
MMPKVLIVDDSRIVRKTTLRELRDQGYELFEAENGQEALDMVEQLPFDLVILDIMMPVMDGIEACRHIKQRRDFIPVIVSTGMDAKRNDDIIAAGADDILHKPVDGSELRMRVASYLRHKAFYDKLLSKERLHSALAMAATANHEINQPLMVLAGNIEMLDMYLSAEAKDEVTKRYLARMQDSVSRIQSILTRFKNSTSVEMGAYTKGIPMAELGDNENGVDDDE